MLKAKPQMTTEFQAQISNLRRNKKKMKCREKKTGET